MGSTTKRCRVCGKEYEACRSTDRGTNVFRWQEVACSPDCGAVYLRQINESRNNASTPKKSKRKREVELNTAELIGVADMESTADSILQNESALEAE